MPTNKSIESAVEQLNEGIIQSVSRRRFLGYVGGASALLVTAASCKKDDNTITTSGGVDLGSGDVGILNYAYALEQLEAAFYTQVAASPYAGITASETSYLTDIRNHEVAHREFFKAALTGAAPNDIIPGLSVDFSTINFANRDSVLGTAKAFEDLGVTAYNGAGPLLKTAAYLTLAGKIVSVEARHAALIRELIAVNSFADSTAVDANGLDGARKPSEVLAIAGKYLKTKVTANNLP